MRNSTLFAVLFIGGLLASSITVSAVLFAKNNSSLSPDPVSFSIQKGDGMKDIARALHGARLINSENVFKVSAFVMGKAHLLKPGVYILNPQMSVFRIISTLSRGPINEAEVVIPEGYTLIQIDAELAKAGVLTAGSLIQLAKKVPLEGYLFPDTYRFYLNSTTTEVVKKMTDNFDAKARLLLEATTRGDQKKFQHFLIVASLVEGEVPGYEDRRKVAGVIEKRLAAQMGLQIDATICYIKEKRSLPCEPIFALDLKIDSPYNTYLHKGLPPTPINNPGLDAIKASLSPESSPYWFYLSNPNTKATHFAKTLDEHRENRAKYLDNQ